MNHAGAPSDATIDEQGIIDFTLAQNGVVANYNVGQLNLPAIPALLPFETYKGLVVTDNMSMVATLLAGGQGASIPLYTTHTYQIEFKYNMDVPYGQDPNFAEDYAFTVAVPEPTSLALCGVAVLGLMRRPRR